MGNRDSSARIIHQNTRPYFSDTTGFHMSISKPKISFFEMTQMKKGTVRTLLCYPIGVLGVTVGKLLYAALAGLIFAGIAFFLPTLGIGKPAGEVLLVFLSAYVLSLATVASASAPLRVTSLPYLLSCRAAA